MAFVNKQGGAERLNETADAGPELDFDPNDDRIVKVHYDVSAWTFDQQAELAEALAEASLPHAWDGVELVVPEIVEERVDQLFETLEQRLGPFPIGLAEGEPSTEFQLDEWAEAERAVLTTALVEAEVPHRWEGSTVVVAEDAENSVDDLLDAIESGELFVADEAGADDPPDGVLTDIFLAADKLAKNPLDATARSTLIELAEVTDDKHPPYAFAPRTWQGVVAGVNKIVDRVVADASGTGDESSDVIEYAQELRSLLRPYV